MSVAMGVASSADYVFEVSWEVCNKVGGIYTVLSSHASLLSAVYGDRLVFVGPDVWSGVSCPYFVEDSRLLSSWRRVARDEGLLCRVGRWAVAGSPVAILVDFHSFFSSRDTIYARLWETYRVDSLHAFGDYDASCLFAYAAGCVVASYCRHVVGSGARVVLHAHEWQSGAAALYIAQHMPSIATVFTTHATSIGRSICGNGKPLYAYLYAYDGDQMACELNMQSKHSLEKQTAHHVDCFTTVSDITAEECRVLLDKTVDCVLPNGFDNHCVPRGQALTTKRRLARTALLRLAHCLTGKSYPADTLIMATSGRYEFRNKGIDIFLSAVDRLRRSNIDREVVALIAVPGWVKEPRSDLRSRLLTGDIYCDPLPYPQLTHWLHNQDDDAIMSMCMQLDLWNRPTDKVTVVFVPCYLTGNDGIVNLEYYDVLLANDLCIFPSYYEPWGYTPLEAIAFHVPCITTDLAGFGRWVNKELGKNAEICDGVEVVHRTDYNYDAVAEEIKDTVTAFAALPATTVRTIRSKAARLSQRALWKKFISHYYDAYAFALQKAMERINSLNINNYENQNKLHQ